MQLKNKSYTKANSFKANHSLFDHYKFLSYKNYFLAALPLALSMSTNDIAAIINPISINR